ncbi:homoserine kinase [Phytoactinopolyspora halotolerans]|uniref:Homoserine kinase n=1 Tax=Phytoactinopolyspora halotolerans TaxID=1981512 RepID=A0A6L9S659_9ACTN|nr:homoserine kinase [Phytoactinopolyspora halotolerans]
MDARVVVRAPATSANLGPGFDALGLALSLHDVVEAAATFTAASTGGGAAPGSRDGVRRHAEQGAASGARALELSVDVEGVGAEVVPRDEKHLVVRAMRACFDELGVVPTRLELTCRNVLPHGRGLGSSSAAIVAGVVAARALAGADVTGQTALADALALAGRIEGHPDNVAPCLLGGFTIAWTHQDGEARAARLDPHPAIAPVLCVPSTELATATARGLLPDSVPHADAARTAGRAALLVEAVTRRPDLLFEATEDRLHQAYREPAMPESVALMSALRRRGLAAVVSGAGPSILVLSSGDEASVVREVASGWDVRELAVDTAGAVVSGR